MTGRCTQGKRFDVRGAFDGVWVHGKSPVLGIGDTENLKDRTGRGGERMNCSCGGNIVAIRKRENTNYAIMTATYASHSKLVPSILQVDIVRSVKLFITNRYSVQQSPSLNIRFMKLLRRLMMS